MARAYTIVKEEFNFGNEKTVTGSIVPNASIVETSDCRKKLVVNIAGTEYGFNVDWVDQENMSWLAYVTASHLQECHDRAVRGTKDRFKFAIRRFLDLFDIQI